jgi:hypothetical protein
MWPARSTSSLAECKLGISGLQAGEDAKIFRISLGGYTDQAMASASTASTCKEQYRYIKTKLCTVPPEDNHFSAMRPGLSKATDASTLTAAWPHL